MLAPGAARLARRPPSGPGAVPRFPSCARLGGIACPWCPEAMVLNPFLPALEAGISSLSSAGRAETPDCGEAMLAANSVDISTIQALGALAGVSALRSHV